MWRSAANLLGPKHPLRLGAACMVYNEAELIEHNIRHHAKMGVDVFFLLNNGSTDATRAIVETLAKTFEIHLFEQPLHIYQQARWMTWLNRQAGKHGCNLVINPDADEFYLPAPGKQLRDLLRSSDSVVRVHRANMLLEEGWRQPEYKFWHSRWKVIHPIYYSTTTQLQQSNISISLAPISPKVICNPAGLIRLKGGNHRARHLWQGFNARTEPWLEVVHYPFRHYQSFYQSVLHRKKLLAAGASMGYHYKRWIAMLDANTLEEEFARQVFSPQQTDILSRYGVISTTDYPVSLLGASAAT